MKALFIRPPDRELISGETPRYELGFAGHYPPLGMMSIATCINEWSGHQAEVLDAALLEMSGEEIGRAVKRAQPDVVGLSSTTFTMLDTLRTAALVKQWSQDVPVVIGGVHAALFPRQTVALDDIDFAVIGDGEKTFLSLMDHLEGKGKLKDIPGVVGLQAGKRVEGKRPKPITDLDSLPPVDRTLTPYKDYFSPFSEQKPWTTMTTSRGCPYRCSFCYRPLNIARDQYRERSPEKVVEELRACVNLGIREVAVYDDTFTANRKRIVELCELMRKEKLDLTWDMRTRPDCVDRELLQVMKAVGLRRAQMGVESGTQKGLNTLRKGFTLKQIEDAFALTRQLKLDSFGYFMLGIPGETREMMEETVRFALKLDPDYANFTVFVPLPGSTFWGEMVREGNASVSERWEQFAASPSAGFDVPTYNGLYPKEELLRILDDAWKAFYLRPQFLLRELTRIRSLGTLVLKARSASRILKSILEKDTDSPTRKG